MNTTTIILITGGAAFALILLLALFFFFRGGGQKPLRYEQRQFGFLTGCLLRLSGNHPSDFERLQPSVAWRFAACGLSVTVPPLIAFFGVLLACNVFEVGGGLGWATGVALFILLLDFVLVATLGGSKSGRAGWILPVYRAMLAFGIGWFIARPAILLVYGSSIDGLSREDRWEEIRKTTEERETLRKDSMAAHLPLAEHYASRRKLLEEELKTVITSKVPVNARIIELDINRQKEDLDGLDGTKPGQGDQYTKRLGYLNEEKDKLAKIEKEEARIQAELAGIAASQEEQLQKLNDDPAFKKLGEAAAKQIGDVQDSRPGWSEREDLLMKWVMNDPGKRLPGLIAIHIVLLLLDLLPLLTMLFVPKKELEDARRAQESEVQAESEWTEKMAPDRAEDLVRDRLTRDRLRQRIAILKETADLRLDFAGHQVLRREQAEAAARPAYFKLRFGTSKPTPEQEAEWEAAAEPLRRAMEKNLRDFDNLVS